MFYCWLSNNAVSHALSKGEKTKEDLMKLLPHQIAASDYFVIIKIILCGRRTLQITTPYTELVHHTNRAEID